MAGRPDFDALKHPRDKRGRFTKSRTVKASAKDKAAAKAVAAAFAPGKDTLSPGYLERIAGGRSEKLDDLAEVNTALRAGDENTPGVAALDRSLIALPDDVLLSRTVPASAFGAVDPSSLAGMKVRDAGFAPAQLGTVAAGPDAVRMHIAVPAGTKAAVDPATNEVVLDRDTEMVVSHVGANTAGGHDMYLTVLPKSGAKSGVKPDGDPPPAKKADTLKVTEKPAPATVKKPAATADAPKAPAVKPGADKPEGESQVRADLMKLKVAALQAQMRERGLKPGKKRKSELVDALVADEMGHDGKADKPAEAKTEPSGPKADAGPSFDARVKTAVTGEDALNAAPLSLVRTDTHSRLGNRQGLTADQRSALLDYQGGDYALINDRLRDLDQDPAGTPDEPSTQSRIDDLDAAMTGSTLSKDVTVYRGITRSRTVFGNRVNADLTGMVWREAGFVSTTTVESVTSPFAGSKNEPLVMRIIAPAGTHAVQVSGLVDAAGHEDEAELLLDRGIQLRVATDHGFVDGVRRIDVEVVP